MSALLLNETQNELVRLAWYANSFAHAAFSPVLELSVLDRVETAVVFDRLRAALRGSDVDAVHRALDELTGGAR